MSFPTRIVFAVALTLLAVGTLAYGQFFAVPFEPLREPVIVSGEDIGFRIEGSVGDRPAGRLVIRRDGEWVAPEDVPPDPVKRISKR